MSQATTNPQTAPRALVVEDEPPLAALVGEYLTQAGFDVRISYDGPAALAAAREFTPDLTILDVGLPALDGIDVCRELRRFSDCYVIMLTARADEVDKLVGLSVGADDYLTKPFSPRELVARAKAMLRRPRTIPGVGTPPPPTGGLVVDSAAREVWVQGSLVELTATEFNVLATLAAKPNIVFSRRQLIEAVWGADWVGDDRMVDVHIRNLRRKLGDDASTPRYIRTIRGVGYRIGPGQ